MHDRRVHALQMILSASPLVEPIGSVAAWWERHCRAIAGVSLPIEEAIVGGFFADRLGYAFAAGYQAALRRLFVDLPRDEVAAFCVTERGGGAPSAIEARLVPHGEGLHTLRGQKRWATFPGERGVLFVAASEGTDERGKKRLRVARIASNAPGVLLEWMPETPFVPEIRHAEVRLEDAPVSDDALLPGDGYARYIKPFRTVEDIHVQAATLAYLLRESRVVGAAGSLVEQLSAVLATLHGLAAFEPSAPEVHIALGGALRLSKALMSDVELLWARAASPTLARWERDKGLFGIAEGARTRRLEQAWRHFDGIAAAGGKAEKAEVS